MPDLETHNVNGEAARLLMHHLDRGQLRVGNAPQAVQDWLESLGLPLDLLRFLQWSWPQEECSFGAIDIHGSESLPLLDRADVFLASKLLRIGSGPNGDFFAIDFSVDSCPVGFVTHEEWDGESDPRPHFEPVTRSIESFLNRVAEDRFVPCDYYAAREFNEFLRDESEHRPYPPYDRIES